MAITLTLEEIAVLQGSLAVAMNTCDNLAAEASGMGDREALSGSHRAQAYYDRAAARRTQSGKMHALFTKLVVEHGDLRNRFNPCDK